MCADLGGQGFGCGSNPPGAQVPFGAMRLSPDTALDTVALEWEHFGGYYHGEALSNKKGRSREEERIQEG